MSKIKATIVTIIVLTLVQNAFTQEKKHLITAGGGISYLTLSDKNMSPMNYAGVPRLATMGLAIETSAYIDDVALFFGRGNLTMRLSSGEADSKAKITLGNINYIHVRRLHSIASENNKFFLGGIFSSSIRLFKRDYFGETFYYCYQSSLGPAFVFRHALTEDKRLQVGGQVDIALISFVIHPSYGSYIPERILSQDLSGLTARDFITGGKILALNKFQRYNCITYLSCSVYKKVSFQLNYRWDFLHLQQPDDMFQALHSVYISIIVN